MKPEKFFYSPTQLKRYKYACEIAQKFIDLQEKGYLIFDEEKQIVGGVFEIETDFDEDSWGAVWIKEGDCRFILVDISYWDDGRPYIETMKHIKEIFSAYMAVDPKHITKVI
jgi:hypothetical protein